MSSTPFGEHLKRERELRGVSLDEIAAATRIKTSFLEALENGRWNELPGGAFNRGFVRATAHFLGLDEDGMVAEYALEIGGESQAKAPSQPSGALPRDYRPALIAVSVFFLLLIGAVWFIHHRISVRRQKAAAAAMAAATTAASSTAPTKTPASAATNAAAATSIAPGATPATPPNPSPAGPAVTNSAPSATDPLKLRLETSKTTRVQVNGDGKILFKGRLHSDDPKNFQAREGFEVVSNDPGVVKLQLNGQSVPFSGKAGRHGASVSISRKDLKNQAGPAH
jgi:cytoskeleton protein RodZ